MTEELTAEFQRAVDTMVHHNVLYCVSNLMSEILPALYGSGEYMYEATNLLYGRTYWVPWFGALSIECDGFDTEEKAQEWIDKNNEIDDIPVDWQIDERHDEIFEHWIVSSWFKDKLREKGEIVEDIYNVDVWARTTTGQAISLDGLICEIYRETK